MNNNFLQKVAVSLATAGIVGGIILYGDSRAQDTRISDNEEQLNDHDKIVREIPVIKADIENMKGNMKTSHEAILKALERIERLGVRDSP